MHILINVLRVPGGWLKSEWRRRVLARKRARSLAVIMHLCRVLTTCHSEGNTPQGFFRCLTIQEWSYTESHKSRFIAAVF